MTYRRIIARAAAAAVAGGALLLVGCTSHPAPRRPAVAPEPGHLGPLRPGPA